MKALTTFRIFLFATAKIFLSSWGKKKNSAAFILAFVIHNSAYMRKLLNSKHPYFVQLQWQKRSYSTQSVPIVCVVPTGRLKIKRLKSSVTFKSSLRQSSTLSSYNFYQGLFQPISNRSCETLVSKCLQIVVGESILVYGNSILIMQWLTHSLISLWQRYQVAIAAQNQ